jgi:hypothetical protein
MIDPTDPLGTAASFDISLPLRKLASTIFYGRGQTLYVPLNGRRAWHAKQALKAKGIRFWGDFVDAEREYNVTVSKADVDKAIEALNRKGFSAY